jgi:DNA polymerase-3 subunit alpha
MNYSPIHTHTEFSLLDGAIRIPELVDYLVELGIESCAITDHGWMGGCIEFYKECNKKKIKPLLGFEAYLTDDPNRIEQKTRDNYHLVLIAKDNEGYSKLLNLCSQAHTENFYYKPRIFRPFLKELSGHVVALSACLASSLGKRLVFNIDSYGRAINCTDPEGIVQKEIEFYLEIFKDDFYLEIQAHNEEDRRQEYYNQFLKEAGRKLGIPLVITTDAHFLKKEDFALHEMVMAMQLKLTLDQYRSTEGMHYGPEFYVQTPNELLMAAKRFDCEEAYSNTVRVADKCNVDIELGVYKPPIFRIEREKDYSDFKRWLEKNNDRIQRKMGISNP